MKNDSCPTNLTATYKQYTHYSKKQQITVKVKLKTHSKCNNLVNNAQKEAKI